MSEKPSVPTNSELPTVAPPGLPSREIPERTPENCVCLRGPCRHYWEMKVDFDYGNPAGTFEELGVSEPQLRAYSCQLDLSMDMREHLVFECNKWDPLQENELIRIRDKRDTYQRSQKGDSENE